MTTYGWAFMVILASVGVLGYFGFLNPSKYIPESCEFGEQLKCEDHYFDTDNKIQFRFRNNFEAPIEITGANITNDEDVTINNFDGAEIDTGEIKKISFKAYGIEANPNKKSNLKIELTFNRVGGSVEHTIQGTLFTEVSDAQLLS